ncbi:MAG: acetyl-CoA hydrolase/transferase family protein [Acidimicrobiales bacterium]
MTTVPAPRTASELVDDLLAGLGPDADLVVPIANGEPVGLLDELEARVDHPGIIRIHQMHVLRDRPYLHGVHRPRLQHVSWFLSPITRPLFHAGALDFAPANFSEIPRFLRAKEPAAVLAAASAPDRLGYFSLGVCADYAAALIGRVPFYLEVNPAMPRTYGANRLHVSEVMGWCTGEHELVQVPQPTPSPTDRAVAALVADRVPHGATLQLGIGSIPSAVATLLVDHRNLGVHTELLADPIVDLVEAGAVTGIDKRAYRGRIVTTFALGTRRLYDFCDGNDSVIFLSVDEVNDPRNIGREPNFISINGTLEVDLFGQCASETLGSSYWSGSGGQADFARGAQYSAGGDGFVVLRSTTGGGDVSRIVPTLKPGAVVTTTKNTVDNVVTEHGVAELRGRTVAERARALISVAAPHHREELEREATRLGLVR